MWLWWYVVQAGDGVMGSQRKRRVCVLQNLSSAWFRRAGYWSARICWKRVNCATNQSGKPSWIRVQAAGLKVMVVSATLCLKQEAAKPVEATAIHGHDVRALTCLAWA